MLRSIWWTVWGIRGVSPEDETEDGGKYLQKRKVLAWNERVIIMELVRGT